MTFENVKTFWQKNKRSLWALIALVSLVVMLLGLLELLAYFDVGMPDWLEPPLMEHVGRGAWFFVFIGGITTILGWMYFHDYNKKHKRFEDLIDTNSKASFLRNIVEIEELAIDLGPEYEKRVIDKKDDLRIKTR